MLRVIGLQNPDVGCGARCGMFEKVDKLPLMGSPIPMLAIYLAYIVFVLKIGPDFMRNRKPYGLKNVMLAYNFVQVILSAYMVIRYGTFLRMTGLLPSKCYLKDAKYEDEILLSIWIYSMVKISDLLDTIFFVLRKKNNQITFLHIYHHSMMMVGSWMFLKYVPSESVVFTGACNALIHFFMYGYYGLAALGPHMAPYLTWKKYLTSMQLVQFVAQISHYLFTLKYSDCPPSQGVSIFISLNIVIFIVLFGNFYRQSYSKKEKSEFGRKNCCSKAKPS